MAYEPYVGFGTRKGVIYELDEFDVPAASTTAPYTGEEIYGIRNLAMTLTNVRRIAHYDGDKVGLTQILPTLDVPSGTITVDGVNPSLNALLGNVLKTTISGIELLPMMTDQQGNEPEVGLLVYQAAKKNSGGSGWHTTFVPSTQMIPVPGSYGDNNYEVTYQLSPSASTAHLWGFPFADNTDGTLYSSWIEAFSSAPPRVTAWAGNSTENEFLFDTSLQATDTSYKVYQSVAGTVTEVTTDITKATTGITFDTGSEPATGTTIIAIHQVAL